MDFQGKMFDMIIDKGTFDSIMVCYSFLGFGANRQCADTSLTHMNKYLDGVDKCLTEGGTFVIMSYGEPKYRDKYLRREDWGYKVVEVPLLELEPPKDDKKQKNNRNKKKKRKPKKKKVK